MISGQSDLCFFTEFWVKNFETFWNFQKSFWWPKKPWNHPKTIHIWFPLLTRPLKNMLFCPKGGHTCQIDQIGKGRENLLHGVYGSTVKNLTLTFWPQIFSWLQYMYRNSPRKFGRKTQCYIFQGRPVLLGHVFRGTLKKCRKWHVLLNLATRGCHWVKFKFRHASTLGEGHLGQRWRI